MTLGLLKYSFHVLYILHHTISIRLLKYSLLSNQQTQEAAQ